MHFGVEGLQILHIKNYYRVKKERNDEIRQYLVLVKLVVAGFVSQRSNMTFFV